MTLLPALLLVSILTVLTYTSIKGGILPHKWTLGGALAGILLSILLPKVAQQPPVIMGIKQSLLGWVVGLFSVWILIEVGRVFFGGKTMSFPDGMSFSVVPDENLTPVLRIGDSVFDWAEVFTRSSDRVILEGASIAINSTAPIDRPPGRIERVSIGLHQLWLNQTAVPLAQIVSLSGTVSKLILPREVMGFGVALMTAMIGSFLGWQGALIILLSSLALLSAVMAMHAMISRRIDHGRLEVAPCMLVCTAAYVIHKHWSMLA